MGRTKIGVAVASVGAVLAVACVAVPLYVIRPFVPQAQDALAYALEVRRIGPTLASVCVVIGLGATIWCWGQSRVMARALLGLLLAVTLSCAWGTRVNIFEKMFHPYTEDAFLKAEDAPVDADDKVLAVSLGGEAHAYPVRTMGYHHVVNDMVGGVPIAVTYCTLCHTGLVWKRAFEGRTLRFRLAGINNGNALVQDEQTGTVWQQSTGEAIFGPLKGRRLEVVSSDELTFALWKTEQPHGQVLKSDPAYVAQYDRKDWERHVAATRVVIDTKGTGIDPHRLMLGVTVAGKSKAYPMDTLLRAKVVVDEVGGLPVLLLVGPDGASVRVFEARVAGRQAMTFVQGDTVVRDGESGSTWNFKGCAVSGPLAGTCLPAVESHQDYWFDWFHHHEGTAVYRE